MNPKILIIFLFAMTLLSACTTTPPGMVLGGNLVVVDAPGPASAFVSGQLVVKLKREFSLRAATAELVNGARLRPMAALGGGVHLVRVDGRNDRAVLEVASALSQMPEVEYAQPNYLIQPQFSPDDSLFSEQWNLVNAKLPQAWDLETGSRNPVTVAVVDSGILWRQGVSRESHPDLAGRVLSGYDFISDPSIASDGDGRDPDPYDDGNSGSGFHGSHVAGILAAASNNAQGIAGVSGGARILPVRVLGIGGGSVADLADAILWSAGLAVPGVPTNLNPAKVINLSLGSAGQCSDNPVLQDAITKAQRQGSVVVVAASNANADVSNFYPAGCSGVMAVGAVTRANSRATYSNYGLGVGLMAPGGAVGDGVLSLGRDSATGDFIYVREAGTSMAAPHVAGVAALLLSRKPSLTPAQVSQALRQSATPISATQCNRSDAAECGAGLLNAEGAIRLLDAGLPPPEPVFSLIPQRSQVELVAGQTMAFEVRLDSQSALSGQPEFEVVGLPAGIDAKLGAYTTATQSVRISLSASNAVSAQTAQFSVVARLAGRRADATISLTVVTPLEPSKPKDIQVWACYWAGDGCDPAYSRTLRINGLGAERPFHFDGLELGGYYLFAWSDENQNGQIGDGDFFGVWGEPNLPGLIRTTQTNIPVTLYTWNDAAWVSREAQKALRGFRRLVGAR
jgi:serine protease